MSVGYTIEGFNLHQPELGYTLLESTAYAPEISPNRVNLRIPNFHGQVPLWNDELTETKLLFKVRLRDEDPLGLQAKWEHLRALMWTGSNRGLTVRRVITGSGSTQQITSTFAQLETMNQPDFWCAVGMIDVVFILNAPSGRWQSIQTFEYTFPNANPQVVPFVSESTAPNTDVLIRIGPGLTTAGAWVEVTDLTSRTGVQIFPNRTTSFSYVLVDMATRRVWLNNDDSFDAREQEITSSATLRTVLGGNLSLVPIPSFNPQARSSSVKMRRSTGAASVSVALQGRRTYI